MVNHWLRPPLKRQMTSHLNQRAEAVRIALSESGDQVTEASPLRRRIAKADNAIGSARRTLAAEQGGLEALNSALAGPLGQAFQCAVGAILAMRGRVIVSGIGKSGHVGRKIAATLASTGTPAYFVHPSEASHGDLGMIQPEDAILALSWSGETSELAPIIAYAARFSVTLIAITSDEASVLARAADHALTLPKAAEACPNGLAPTTSTIMQMALGDALAVALLEARGFSAREFGVLHPGGRLGAGLRLVGELMHGVDDLPLVLRTTPVSDAIIPMSAKRFGCVIVIEGDGQLAGIFTDGDLRRAMAADALKGPVDHVMSAHPRSIATDAIASEAVERMQAGNPVTVLVVVEEGKPVGLVHLHDLLRAGVV